MSSAAPDDDDSGYPKRSYAWGVLAILVATAIVSYTDRQVLSLLVDHTPSAHVHRRFSRLVGGGRCRGKLAALATEIAARKDRTVLGSPRWVKLVD